MSKTSPRFLGFSSAVIISLSNKKYAPTEKSKEEEKENFYNKLEEEVEKVPREDTLIVLGDFNAQIGKEEYLKQVVGKHTVHEDTNDNGLRMCNMAERTNMIVSSTRFKHPERHKVTWVAPDQRTFTQIDHVLVSRRKQSAISDVRTYRGACADSDYYIVTVTLRQRLKRLTEAKNRAIRWDTEKLQDMKVRTKYSEEVAKEVRLQLRAEGSVEDQWDRIRRCVNGSAENNVGVKRNTKRKEWYNDECREFLVKKIAARQRWLRTNGRNEREEYERRRRECNRLIRRCKREWMDGKIEEIEKDNNRGNTKAFYRRVNEQKRTYKGKISGMRNRQGRVVEDTDQLKQIWVEYFEELLYDPEEGENVDEDESEEVAEDNRESINEPTLVEVKEIINKSRNGKAPGRDNVNIELIKYGGEELHEEIYRLIRSIWREERMPDDWRKGQIVTIHKKGDQQLCKNYRGITLLNTTYKIMSSLIQRRLSQLSRSTVGQYQCGFTKGRSTTDAIHAVKQIMEKTYEHRIDIEMLFIDFRQAFDLINRRQLMSALKELGIHPKLRRLISMTMFKTTVSIKFQRGITEEIGVNKGVRQGDALSATLFNLALEYVVRKINTGTLRTRGGQIIAYADDIVLVTKRRKIMKDMLSEIIEEGKKIGLEINEDKTKIMRIGKKLETREIKIGQYNFEEVDKFKYLGVTISSQGDRRTEIKEKIVAANRAFHANKKLLKSKVLRKETKMKVYRTMIRPILLYAAETMTMTKRDEEDMRVMERKIMRAILGPIRLDNGEYRQRMNCELLQEIGDDIVKKIKEQRVKWLGHIWRGGTETTVYVLLKWDPGGRRRRGRPRSKWLQEVMDDLDRAGITDWEEKTENRKLWREISREV